MNDLLTSFSAPAVAMTATAMAALTATPTDKAVVMEVVTAAATAAAGTLVAALLVVTGCPPWDRA